MKQSLAIDFNRHLTALVRLPGDSDVAILRKKVYLAGLSGITLIVVILHLGTWGQLPPLPLHYGLVFLGVSLIEIVLFIWLKRGLEYFLFFSITFSNLWAFSFILALGGITHSCGLFLTGLACLVWSMVYPSARLLWWGFFLFALTLILTAGLEPYLPPGPSMPPFVSIYLYVVNSLWMSANILLLIFYIFRREKEMAQEKAVRLEETDALRSRLFANIAHEFRTPLTLIRGMAELVREDPSHGRKERTEVIERSADKVLHLVDEMLNLARLEAGAMPLHVVQSDIARFLRHLVDTFAGLAEHRKVRLHFLPETDTLWMDFDPEKVEGIIGNLLSNGLKYTPSGGDVYLGFHLFSDAPERLVIRVRDTGVGIPPEKMSYIFDRFYRIEDDTRQATGGSGIGLTLVREYVKLIGGEITVSSKPGEGSEFTVILPVTRQAPVQMPLAHPAETGQANRFPGDDRAAVASDVARADGTGPDSLPCLLVIEDNPDMCEFLQLVLGRKYRILSARNGDEGVRMAVDHVPDLILSDVMMPGMDGFQVCRTLKKDFRTSHIPIVLLTARADSSSRVTGLEAGADAYLAKPFNRRELFACLQNLFTQREKLRIKYASIGQLNIEYPSAGPDERFMAQVQNVLEANYADESFGIENLLKSLGISRVQLHRKLTALTGEPASHYIRKFRLKKARHLLCTTSKSVAEVAYATGFSDPNYFSRVFTQAFDMTPTELRNHPTRPS